MYSCIINSEVDTLRICFHWTGHNYTSNHRLAWSERLGVIVEDDGKFIQRHLDGVIWNGRLRIFGLF